MAANKTAFVTGASGEIGASVCRELAAMGYDVCAGFFANKSACESLCAELREKYKVRAESVLTDLSEPASVSAAAEFCVRSFGEPSVLVNNGGCEYIGLFQDMEISEILRVVNTDLTGSMLLTRQLLHGIISNRGSVVNVTSVWGEVGASCEVAYSAAKAGLIGFTRALAKELAPTGARVNAVSPGFIDTRMNSQLTADERAAVIDEIPADRAGAPQEVAAAVGFLVSDKASYITGQVLRIDGGWI